MVVVGTELVVGTKVVDGETSAVGETAKYCTKLFVARHLPVFGQRSNPVSPFAHAKSLFCLLGFATMVPASKHRPAVASNKYLVALLIHICGAALEALHLMENSMFGLQPPLPGSRNSEVLITTQMEIIGDLDCESNSDFRNTSDFANEKSVVGLTAASALRVTRPSMSKEENTTAITRNNRRTTREASGTDRYHAIS